MVATSLALVVGVGIGVWALLPTFNEMLPEALAPAPQREQVVLAAPEYVDTYPRIPGAVAVAKAPKWLVEDAPFDAEAFFAGLPEAENAAPLYLDAMTEFDGEAANCFPPNEQPARRARGTSHATLLSSGIAKRWDMTAYFARDPAFKSVVDQLNDGYQKLHGAQQRPRCLFPPSIGITITVPHLPAATAAGRAVAMKGNWAAQNGNLPAALEQLECGLRLSHDVRQRGSTVAQLMAGKIEQLCLERVALALLSDSQATVEDCDRVIALIESYDCPTADCLVWAMQSEYLNSRAAIMSIQHRGGEFEPGVMEDKFGAMMGSRPDSVGQVVAVLCSVVGDPAREASDVNARLDARQDSDFQRELALLTEIYQQVAASASQPYVERAKVHSEIRFSLQQDEAYLLEVFLASAFPSLNDHLTRQRAQTEATRLLAAIRRWQLQEEKGSPLPGDLEMIAKAAGLDGVPRDPFGEGPLKLVPESNSIKVYSVGFDQVDQSGKDRAFSVSRPGDLVFEMRGG